MTSVQPLLSIVCVNYNTGRHIVHLLQSMNKWMCPDWEFFLVDNRSAQSDLDLIREASKKLRFQVEIIILPQNLGFARACNRGVEKSSGLYIALLNPDMQVDMDVFTPLTHCLKERQDIGALGVNLVNQKGRPIHSADDFFSPTNKIRELYRALFLRRHKKNLALVPDSHPLQLADVDYVTGALLVTSREIWQRIGNMDELFFMYFEEQDWQMRLRDLGLRRCIACSLRATHFQGKSISAIAKKYNVFHVSGLRFVDKHFHAQKMFYKVALLFWCLIKFTIDAIKRRDSWHNFGKAWLAILREEYPQGMRGEIEPS